MTRINLTQVDTLADQHLLAEWREIKMVPAALRRSLKTQTPEKILSKIPKEFCLNKGHVTFFYDKMDFLKDRYDLLTAELLARGFDLYHRNSFIEFLSDIPIEFMNNWEPTEKDIKISKERIDLRISQKPNWYRFTIKG